MLTLSGVSWRWFRARPTGLHRRSVFANAIDPRYDRAGYSGRIVVDRHRAGELQRQGALDHARPEALARRTLDCGPAALAPAQIEVIVLYGPHHGDVAALARQGAILDRVGAEFVHRHRQGDGALRP